MTKTNMPLTFMVTFNILTVTNFSTLLQKFLDWRIKYNSDNQTKWQSIRFDTPYLKEPLQYDMNILPKDKFMPYMKQHLQFIINNLDDNDRHKFSELEYENFNAAGVVVTVKDDAVCRTKDENEIFINGLPNMIVDVT